MTENEAPEQLSPLAQREKDLNTFFAFMLALWPFSILGIVFLDGPPPPLQLGLYWATFVYGPVFFVALWIAGRQRRNHAYPQAMRTWLCLCGSNVAIWLACFVLLLATR